MRNKIHIYVTHATTGNKTDKHKKHNHKLTKRREKYMPKHNSEKHNVKSGV